MPTQQSYTFASHTSQPRAKACKRVCLPHAKTNSIFFFPPFGVLIFSPPTADTKTVGQKQRKPLLDKA